MQENCNSGRARPILSGGRSTSLLTGTALALALAATPAAGQQRAEAPTQNDDEIVVTARRVGENLQETPVAVTALTANALEENAIATVTDLQRLAPSLNTALGGPGGPSVAFLSVRGQINTNANSVSDSAVATYVDGVYFARPTSGNFGFLDPAQVEILRGPQGTLFGRNTTGGALTITSVLPGAAFEGYVRGEAGAYNLRRLDAAATIPLSGEEISLRLAGRVGQRDGYIDNLLTGREVQDIDNSWAGRVTLRVAPESLPFDLTLRADRSEYQDNGPAIANVGINTTFAPLAPAGIFTTIGDLFAAQGLTPSDYIYGQGAAFDETFQNPQTQSAAINNLADTAEQEGVSATFEFNLAGWDVRTITAWRRAESANSQDLDGTPIRLISFASSYEQEQRSQEIQATNTFGPLDIIAGALFFEEEGHEASLSEGLGAFPPPFGGGNLALNDSDFDAQSTGVFAQANYRFTDRLRGTLGYRYTWDERSIVGHGLASVQANICSVAPPGQPCNAPFSAEFSYPSWLIGLDYQMTEDAFFYVKSGRASLAGGFNTRPTPPGQEAFDPETVTDYEIGAKLDWLGGALRTNVAIFHTDTEDAQRITNGFVGGRLTQWTQNTGDVETDGAELELRARPWSGGEFTIGAAFVDAGYVSGSFLENRGPLLGGVVDRSGEPIPLVPELSYNVGFSQDIPLSFGLASFRVDWAWIDEKAVTPSTPNANATPAQIAAVATGNRLTTLDAYGLLSASASLELNNGAELTFWGQNLLDEEYFTYAFDGYTSLGFVNRNQGAPQVYGVRIGYSF